MRNDGKYLEKIADDELTPQISTDFRLRRLYDSYTAKGQAYPAQPADFFGCYKKHAFHLEAKTTGNKFGRLPKGSFSQLPSMRAWATCGVTGLLLTHCYGYGDGDVYLVNVMDMDPSLKSWVIPELGEPILVTNLLQEIIKRL